MVPAVQLSRSPGRPTLWAWPGRPSAAAVRIPAPRGLGWPPGERGSPPCTWKFTGWNFLSLISDVIPGYITLILKLNYVISNNCALKMQHIRLSQVRKKVM